MPPRSARSRELSRELGRLVRERFGEDVVPLAERLVRLLSETLGLVVLFPARDG